MLNTSNTATGEYQHLLLEFDRQLIDVLEAILYKGLRSSDLQCYKNALV